VYRKYLGVCFSCLDTINDGQKQDRSTVAYPYTDP
jgi:hypothetical protein